MSQIKISPITSQKQFEIIKQKKTERVKINALISDTHPEHKINQSIIRKRSAESFQYWCDNFAWIQDPEALNPEDKDIPFLLYDFQEKAAQAIIDAVTDQYDLPIEKSRKMGLSWLTIAIFVWGWNFHKWDLLLGSQKGENVDKKGNIKSLMEKARYIISRTPDFLIPALKDKEHDKWMLLSHPISSTTLAGEANNVNFGRSDRRKAILFDEFASWEQTDRAAWQACSATAKCRIPLSTPNTRGTNCYYYQIVKDTKRKNKPSLYLHWTLHPHFAKGLYYPKDDTTKKNPRSPWYDNEVRRSSSAQEVAQEIDINYEASMGGNVFPGFNIDINVQEDLEYDPNLPLYTGWDFGLDGTAIIWFQPDKKNGTINIIDEYMNTGAEEGTSIYHYIDIMQAKPYKTPICYGDPHSGNNSSLSSGASNATILRRFGFVFKSQRTKVIARLVAGNNILENKSKYRKTPYTFEYNIKAPVAEFNFHNDSNWQWICLEKIMENEGNSSLSVILNNLETDEYCNHIYTKLDLFESIIFYISKDD